MKKVIFLACYLLHFALLVSCELDTSDAEQEEDVLEEDNQIEYGISDFFPKEVGPGDTLTISGLFNRDSVGMKVSFFKYQSFFRDSIDIELLSFSESQIKAAVRSYLPNSKNFLLQVSGNNFSYMSEDFIYLKPQISRYFTWSPRTPRVGELLLISGIIDEEIDLATVRVKFHGSDFWLSPIRYEISETQQEIKRFLVRVPDDAKAGPLEMYSEGHAAGKIQSSVEILPRNPLPVVGQWTRMADMGLGYGNYNWTMAGATFVVGDKAYIVGGHNPSAFGGEAFGRTDLWEYDTNFDSWFKKAPFPGGNIVSSVAFSINGVGYVGTGLDENSEGTKRFYAYDPVEDKWEQKADFPGGKRAYAVGFSLGGKGYIGSGSDDLTLFDDFFQYDPVTDSWVQVESIPTARSEAYSFVADGKAYVGGGHDVGRLNDLYMFDPREEKWYSKSGIPGDTFTSAKTAFTIGSHAYVGMGYDKEYYLGFVSTNAVRKYSPENDRWENFPTLEGSARSRGVGFAINGIGFFGLGRISGMPSAHFDLWAYAFGE